MGSRTNTVKENRPILYWTLEDHDRALRSCRRDIESALSRADYESAAEYSTNISRLIASHSRLTKVLGAFKVEITHHPENNKTIRLATLTIDTGDDYERHEVVGVPLEALRRLRQQINDALEHAETGDVETREL